MVCCHHRTCLMIRFLLTDCRVHCNKSFSAIVQHACAYWSLVGLFSFTVIIQLHILLPRFSAVLRVIFIRCILCLFLLYVPSVFSVSLRQLVRYFTSDVVVSRLSFDYLSTSVAIVVWNIRYWLARLVYCSAWHVLIKWPINIFSLLMAPHPVLWQFITDDVSQDGKSIGRICLFICLFPLFPSVVYFYHLQYAVLFCRLFGIASTVNGRYSLSGEFCPSPSPPLI